MALAFVGGHGHTLNGISIDRYLSQHIFARRSACLHTNCTLSLAMRLLCAQIAHLDVLFGAINQYVYQ